MKPQSIKLFDYFYLGSMFLGMLGFVTGLPALEAQLANQSAEQGIAIPSAVIIGGYVLGVILGLVLWFFVSRRRSVVAKWIIVGLFLFSLTGVGGYFVGELPLYEIYGLLALIGQAVAVALLFRNDAIRWLEGDPHDEKPAD